uniref:(northern house mosquito) hypothetical protein n=1 Tax=Culex pipiens TaxID=7175 RepID=A0A8D8GDX2_CULPI
MRSDLDAILDCCCKRIFCCQSLTVAQVGLCWVRCQVQTGSNAEKSLSPLLRGSSCVFVVAFFAALSSREEKKKKNKIFSSSVVFLHQNLMHISVLLLCTFSLRVRDPQKKKREQSSCRGRK